MSWSTSDRMGSVVVEGRAESSVRFLRTSSASESTVGPQSCPLRLSLHKLYSTLLGNAASKSPFPFSSSCSPFSFLQQLLSSVQWQSSIDSNGKFRIGVRPLSYLQVRGQGAAIGFAFRRPRFAFFLCAFLFLAAYNSERACWQCRMRYRESESGLVEDTGHF